MRGDKSEDGSQMTADEVVFGSFRTFAVQVTSIAAGVLTVKDLDANACPGACGPSVPGSCFANNGCGNGNFGGCFTCAQCKAKASHPLSWVGHLPPC